MNDAFLKKFENLKQVEIVNHWQNFCFKCTDFQNEAVPNRNSYEKPMPPKCVVSNIGAAIHADIFNHFVLADIGE